MLCSAKGWVQKLAFKSSTISNTLYTCCFFKNHVLKLAKLVANKLVENKLVANKLVANKLVKQSTFFKIYWKRP